jgi:hypothetical protein
MASSDIKCPLWLVQVFDITYLMTSLPSADLIFFNETLNPNLQSQANTLCSGLWPLPRLRCCPKWEHLIFTEWLWNNWTSYFIPLALTDLAQRLLFLTHIVQMSNWAYLTFELCEAVVRFSALITGIKRSVLKIPLNASNSSHVSNVRPS